MIYDVFLFNNEIDLAKFRIQYLYDVVGKFVVTEFNSTFSGKSKNYLFGNVLKQLNDPDKKIIYNACDWNQIKTRRKENLEFFTNFTKKIPYKHGGRSPYSLHESVKREILQRDSSIIPLIKNCSEDDIIIMSDVDEFPERSFIGSLNDSYKSDDIYLNMSWRQYYLNFKVKANWYGSVVSRFKSLQHSSIDEKRYASHIKSNLPGKTVDSGWHFSYLGGAKSIRRKLNNLAYQGLRAELTRFFANISSHYLDLRIRNGDDILNQGKEYKLLSDFDDLHQVFDSTFIKNNIK